MSDTRINVIPGWGPNHPHWPQRFGPMTEKMQTRDQSAYRNSRYSHDRFRNGGKNSRYNLLRKIDELRAEEIAKDP